MMHQRQSRRSTVALLLMLVAPLSLVHFLSIGNNCVLALQTTSPVTLGYRGVVNQRISHHHPSPRVCSLAGGIGCSTGECSYSSQSTATMSRSSLLWRRNKSGELNLSSAAAASSSSSSSSSSSRRSDVIQTEKVGSIQQGYNKQKAMPSISLSFLTQWITAFQLKKAFKVLQSLTVASFYGASEAIRQSYWLFPMTLALIPLYCFMLGTRASMPSWWPVVSLDHVAHSPYAAAIVGGFLLSNIFYFVSGLFMLDLIPLKRTAESRLKRFSRHLARDPLLGVLVLTAGLVSTAYHSVQALGPYTVAQELCYIDHGVALSSGLYFFQKLGLPSWKTLVIGGAGLVSLANPFDGAYAGLHSLWHFLSASATVSWGFDGFQRAYSSSFDGKEKKLKVSEA